MKKIFKNTMSESKTENKDKSTPPLAIIDDLLDGKGYVSVEMVSPYTIPIEEDGSFHPDRTRDYFAAKAARASTGLDLKTPKEDKKLIQYLIRNLHTSPIEMCNITFCIKCPISFGRQFLRHRTGKFNEFSQRYSEVTDEMGRYQPILDGDSIRGQSKMNAQSSEDNLTSEQKEKIFEKMLELEMVEGLIFKGYQDLISLGLTREVARFYLPQSTYTVFYLQMDMNNLMKFLRLRCAPDAQWEIRVYANAMKELAREFFPIMIDQLDEEMNKVVLDKWAIRMIKERRIPDDLKSKSVRKRLEDLAEELNITLRSNSSSPPPWPIACPKSEISSPRGDEKEISSPRGDEKEISSPRGDDISKSKEKEPQKDG